MGYLNLRECVEDLSTAGELVRIASEVDPHLEAAAIHRRVYQARGPAILFTNVKGCRFPLLANIFGTTQRTRFLFRDTLGVMDRLVRLKLDPGAILREPLSFAGVLPAALNLLPKKVSNGPILSNRCRISDLPRIQSWTMDGGAFITLPQVYSESPLAPGFRHSNLGMYRIQISGGEYRVDHEIGIHYQIHRGLGVHHAEALKKGIPCRVNIFVGGPPSLAVAAVMPLPEGMPEISFAGLLGGRRLEMISRPGELLIPAEADFCITGIIEPGKTLPEGPFGDHLGYYSLAHDFPVMRVENVLHRDGAIWPFTTVGRPPQEDTSFGEFIHELTGPLIPAVVPGVRSVHAVDAAGVHPLLLAVGSERYCPYAEQREPLELLTVANAILGQGQLSLAKYLFIAAIEDAPPDIHDVGHFFHHILERVDWRRDLHFQTRTTIDTLDYSGTALNRGSKVVAAAAGGKRRDLPSSLPPLLRLPQGFTDPKVCLPGILAVTGPASSAGRGDDDADMARFADSFSTDDAINSFPLVIVADDSDFVARTLNNFLWVTFTRSDPATDIYGIGSSIRCKHWGCTGSLIIDARVKPHHAPPLIEDPETERRVDALGAPGQPLHGII